MDDTAAMSGEHKLVKIDLTGKFRVPTGEELFMLRVGLICVLVVLSASPLMAGAPSDELGGSDCGVLARVQNDRIECPLGQKPVIHVSMKNTTERALRIAAPSLDSCVRIISAEAQGQTGLRDRLAGTRREPPSKPSDRYIVELKARETATFDILLEVGGMPLSQETEAADRRVSLGLRFRVVTKDGFENCAAETPSVEYVVSSLSGSQRTLYDELVRLESKNIDGCGGYEGYLQELERIIKLDPASPFRPQLIESYVLLSGGGNVLYNYVREKRAPAFMFQAIEYCLDRGQPFANCVLRRGPLTLLRATERWDLLGKAARLIDRSIGTCPELVDEAALIGVEGLYLRGGEGDASPEVRAEVVPDLMRCYMIALDRCRAGRPDGLQPSSVDHLLSELERQQDWKLLEATAQCGAQSEREESRAAAAKALELAREKMHGG
jgi:hypothetical protein